jgi:hypothetical protein
VVRKVRVFLKKYVGGGWEGEGVFFFFLKFFFRVLNGKEGEGV